MRVVERVQPEVDERARRGHGATVHVGEVKVVLLEVPAARAHHDRRRLLVRHRVVLAVRRRVLEPSPNRVEQGQLAADDVLPRGAGRVLLIREPHLRARVERIDGHARIRRARDLDATILESWPSAGDAPISALADVLRVLAEPRVDSVADLVAVTHARGEAVIARSGEQLVQLRQERQRFGREDLLVPPAHRARHGDRWQGALALPVVGAFSCRVDESHDVPPGLFCGRRSRIRRRVMDLVVVSVGRSSADGEAGSAAGFWSSSLFQRRESELLGLGGGGEGEGRGIRVECL